MRLSFRLLSVISFLFITLLFTANGFTQDRNLELVVESPGKANTIIFSLVDGKPEYRVDHGNTPIIQPSTLGLKFANDVNLCDGFTLENYTQDSFDETWTQPWGEVKDIRNNYNVLSVTIKNSNESLSTVTYYFRAYDDGIAFRYELPEQGVEGELHLMDELTEFNLAGDHSAWWIGAYQGNRYEYLYQNTPVSMVDTVHTPITMETKDGLYLSFHEAALTDFSSMALARKHTYDLEVDLYPWADGVKVKRELPFKSPWRTIQIGQTPGDLITSYLILNCNEPNKIVDTSWIKPGKYVGIWWGMHLSTMSWESGEKHGATTENTRRYIDFAAEHGFDGVLVEGWNIGWDGNWIANGDKFSFTKPYPDYDLKGLAKYAREKGTRLIGHNETSTGILNYEKQMEKAFKLYRKLGINTIKSGYVGHGQNINRRDPKTEEILSKEWHHGQFMVRHYRKAVETAVKYGIMIDAHEPIKPTGIRRTWPNMMTREGARGQEYNAWEYHGGNPPEHTTILPFTRLLAGPFDHTPGIFDLTFEEAKPDNRVKTTLVKQLALYVTIYSPLHMAADLVENYEGHPCFQFIEDVPTDWEETIVLNASIGDYVTIARKDRNSEDWYLGSITDENKRSFRVNLDFLDEDKTYIAEIYADSADGDWLTNPYAYDIREKSVKKGDFLKINLAAGGGQAIRFVATTE